MTQMSIGLQTLTKTPPTQTSFKPARANLLQRKCACGGTPGLDDECAECRSKRLIVQRSSLNPADPVTPSLIRENVLHPFGHQPGAATYAFSEPRFSHDFSGMRAYADVRRKVQTKLSIGRSGDSYEREADSVAEQVIATDPPQTQGPSITLQLHPSSEGGSASILVAARQNLPAISPLVQREHSAWGEESIGAKSTDARQSAFTPDAAVVTDSLEHRLIQSQGSGRPLPEPTRHFMEDRFGVDFGNVRVHTDSEASQVNDSLQSLAFTHGQNIYFASGMYNPGTKDGDRLLAHELTHTVQQSGGSATGVVRSHNATYIQRFELKPYRGSAVHKVIERSLRANNPELITEAPIPGGTSTKTELDAVGSADLYISSDKGHVSGIRGEYPKEQRVLEESQRTLEYKPLSPERAESATGAVKSKPTFVAKGRPFLGEFPESFQVADIKPLPVRKFVQEKIHIGGKLGEGIAQISHYIEGFTKFIAQAHADEMVRRGTSRGGKLTGLKIPQGLDYSKFDVEASSKTPSEGHFIARDSRFWLYEMPNWGLYIYFTLPHPYRATKFREAIDKVFAALKKVTPGLRKNQKSINSNLNLGNPKYRPGVTNPPMRRKKHSPPAQRHTRFTIQRKDGPQTDWRALGAEWEKERQQWDTQYAKPFLAKEGSAIGERVAINHLLGLDTGAGGSGFREQSKEYKSIELWSGFTGIALGKARFFLGGTFDKIIEFYDKIREKFHKFHRKMQETPPGGQYGWKAKVIKVLVAAVKIGFKQLLIALFRIFANCFNGVMHKAVDRFTEDIEDSLAEQMKQIHEIFERFHNEIKAEFDKRFGGYDRLIDALKDVSKWANIISGAITTIRLIIQAISCLTPPALGCIWGLVGQLATEAALEIGIPLILDTQEFQEKIVQPAVQDLIKEYAGEQIQGLISFTLGKVGLQEYAKDVKECQITAGGPTPVSALIDPLTGGKRGAELVPLRNNWEKQYQSQMLKSIAPHMETASGQTPTESELNALFEEIRKKNLTAAQLHDIFMTSKNSQTGKFNMASIQAQLRGAAKVGGPSVVLSVPGQIPPRGEARVEFGPLQPVPGGEKAPGAAGAIIRF